MMNDSLKVIFMGTPELALRVLNAIVASKHKVVAVYTQPPKPAGRGQHLKKSPVQERAEELNINVYTPKSLRKDEAARAQFNTIHADIAVVAAYGLILPQEVLDHPRLGCINTHASLLPRWRGAAPINHAIWEGDDKSGVCIMQMDAGLDTGPVLLHGEVAITPDTTAEILYDQLAEQGAELVIKALDMIVAGKPPVPQAQPEKGMTYAFMLNKDHGKIDWTKTSVELDRQLRALTPWPGVWCMHNGKRLKVLEAKIVEGSGKAGEILDKHLTVACGDGALKLIKVQPENKNAMDGASFINGSHIKPGDILE